MQEQIAELKRQLSEARAAVGREDKGDESLEDDLCAANEEQERLHNVVQAAEEQVTALQDELDEARWDLEQCRQDVELNVAHAKDAVRNELKERHAMELS